MLESFLHTDNTRRRFLGFIRSTLISCSLPSVFARLPLSAAAEGGPASTEAAQSLLARLLPQHANQIHLTLQTGSVPEQFQITGTSGSIHIIALRSLPC